MSNENIKKKKNIYKIKMNYFFIIIYKNFKLKKKNKKKIIKKYFNI